MRILLVAFLSVFVLFACNSEKEKTQDAPAEAAQESHEDHAEMEGGLSLNNGAKWKADSSTIGNVDLLQRTVASAKKETLENYHETAAQLQDGLNKMVKECRMKGPDHDALHLWLEPLMSKTKELQQAAAVESAETTLRDIEMQVNLFAHYFE